MAVRSSSPDSFVFVRPAVASRDGGLHATVVNRTNSFERKMRRDVPVAPMLRYIESQIVLNVNGWLTEGFVQGESRTA